MEKILNFKELYQIQDQVLQTVFSCDNTFYLTGGTALHRFYYHYRYSSDLDFFCNNTPLFHEYIYEILNHFEHFSVIVQTRDFQRVILSEKLQVDFINDRVFRNGKSKLIGNYRIDNLQNILANKITAIIGRDEEKDVFDIISIAINEKFDWKNVLKIVDKKEQILTETFIERLDSFPLNWLQRIQKCPSSITISKQNIQTLCEDIANRSENHLFQG